MEKNDSELDKIKIFFEELDKEILEKKENILNTAFYGEEHMLKLLKTEKLLNEIHKEIRKYLENI
jgi:hypothetical protein